jgi:hypothetical protein
MNFQQACEILELPQDSSSFTLKELKYNYHLKALKYHPDKNKSPEAHEKFLEISEAYHYLIAFLKINQESKEEEPSTNNYIDLLTIFLKTMTNNDSIKYQSIEKIVQSISNKTYKMSLVLFEEFDKDTALKLYGYLVQYKDIFHITDTTLQEIETIIREKIKNDNIILLNPTIENILNDEIYKLDYKNETYYVPLWHDELTYDISNASLIIKCVPNFPDHIYIDENNNLHVNISISKTSLFERKEIITKVGKDEYKIPLSKLYIKKTQIYIFGRCGIPLICTKDIYNISERGSVIFHIEIT